MVRIRRPFRGNKKGLTMIVIVKPFFVSVVTQAQTINEFIVWVISTITTPCLKSCDW